MGYTWQEFNDEVRLLLPLDNERDNAQDIIDREIRNAVIDLQGFISRYRVGHETVYCPNDMVLNNQASLGRMPDGARFKEGYIIRTKAGDVVEVLGDNIAANRTYSGTTKAIAVTQNFKYRYTPGANETSLTNGVTVLTAAGDFIASGSSVTLTSPYTNQAVTATLQRVMSGSECICGKHPVREISWESRLCLVDGQAEVGDNNGLIAIDPEGTGAFYVYPAILKNEAVDDQVYSYRFQLVWGGRRLEFGANDKTPFDEPMVDAVACHVSSVLEKRIRRDIMMSESLRSDYTTKRLNLYLNR